MLLRLCSFSALAALAACASSPTDDPTRGVKARTPDPIAVRATDVPEPSLEPLQEEPAQLSDDSPSIPDEPAIVTVAPVPIPPAAPPASAWEFYRERYDADGDGSITLTEYTRSQAAFGRLDSDGDGLVAEPDFAKRWDRVPRVGASKKPFTWGEGGPHFGDPAPGFRLPTTTGEELTLAQFLGKKPVVLVFGSFT